MSTRYKIRQKMLSIGDDFWIENQEGERAFHWTVNVRGGPDLDVQGNILDHEYSIMERRRKIAEVSKKWFSLTDTYAVEIDSEQNDILILAVAIAIDMMSHDEDKKARR